MKTKAELKNNGKRQQKVVSSDMLGTLAHNRDPVKIIQITRSQHDPRAAFIASPKNDCQSLFVELPN